MIEKNNLLKHKILKEFSTWNLERQLKEYQGYKSLGNISPINFSDDEFYLMETIIDNQNIEISVECTNGFCELVGEVDKIKIQSKYNEFELLETEQQLEVLEEVKLGTHQYFSDADLPQLEDIISYKYSVVDDDVLNESDSTQLPLFSEVEKEKFELLLSIIFDTNSKYENDQIVLKFDNAVIDPLSNLFISAKSEKEGKTDILFSKMLLKSQKNSYLSIVKSLFNNDEKNLTFGNDNDAAKKIKEKLNISTISINELFDYPIFNFLFAACIKSAKYNNVLNALFPKSIRSENVANLLKIPKLKKLFSDLSKQIDVLYGRLKKPEVANEYAQKKEVYEKQLDEIKKEIVLIDDKIANIKLQLSNLPKKSKDRENMEKEIDIQHGNRTGLLSQQAILNSIIVGMNDNESLVYNDEQNSYSKDVSPVRAQSEQSKDDSDIDKKSKSLTKMMNDNPTINSDIKKILKYFKGKTIDSTTIEDLNNLLNIEEGEKRIKFGTHNISSETIAFLQKSFDTEGKGFGKGELFFVFTMGSTAQGGGSSFDVVLGSDKFEVKSYDLSAEGKMDGNGIRLGTYGNMNNFDEFNYLSELLKKISLVFDGKNFGILNSMYNAAEHKDFSTLLQSESKTNRPLLSILRSGEITPENIDEFSEAIFRTKQALSTAMNAIKKNDYQFVELFGAGISSTKYILKDDQIPTPIFDETGVATLSLQVAEMNDESKFEFINAVRDLESLPAWTDQNFVLNALKSINASIMEEMRRHKLILVSNKKTPRKIHGVFDTFVVCKITQSVVRIIPSELEPDSIKRMYANLALKN